MVLSSFCGISLRIKLMKTTSVWIRPPAYQHQEGGNRSNMVATLFCLLLLVAMMKDLSLQVSCGGDSNYFNSDTPAKLTFGLVKIAKDFAITNNFFNNKQNTELSKDTTVIQEKLNKMKQSLHLIKQKKSMIDNTDKDFMDALQFNLDQLLLKIDSKKNPELLKNQAFTPKPMILDDLSKRSWWKKANPKLVEAIVAILILTGGIGTGYQFGKLKHQVKMDTKLELTSENYGNIVTTHDIPKHTDQPKDNGQLKVITFLIGFALFLFAIYLIYTFARLFQMKLMSFQQQQQNNEMQQTETGSNSCDQPQPQQQQKQQQQSPIKTKNIEWMSPILDGTIYDVKNRKSLKKSNQSRKVKYQIIPKSLVKSDIQNNKSKKDVIVRKQSGTNYV